MVTLNNMRKVKVLVKKRKAPKQKRRGSMYA